MLQRISQAIKDEFLGKCCMGIFFMKAGYLKAVFLMLSLKFLASKTG